jgi:putative oxidoreductase
MGFSIRPAPPRLYVVNDDGTSVSFSRVPQIGLALLRVVAGLMLVQHGLQKHFGLLLPPDMPFISAPAPFSQMWIAGTLEMIGGTLLALGVLTRLVAFILSGMMAVAYFQVHAPQGFWPILNQGELAALYCFVFLMFAAVGGGPYSVDGLIARRQSRRRPTMRGKRPSRRERIEAVDRNRINADLV